MGQKVQPTKRLGVAEAGVLVGTPIRTTPKRSATILLS